MQRIAQAVPITKSMAKAMAVIEARRRAGVYSEFTDKYRAFQQKYREDRSGFVRECIQWEEDEGATGYQEEMLTALETHRRVAVRGPHGLGKTAVAAWCILHFALCYDGEDWKVPTTASNWRQLINFLWPEVSKWARRLRWDVIGREPFSIRELLTRSIKLRTGEAFALASDNPAAIEGAHGKFLLYIFDEARSIPGDTYDAAEGAFSTGECYALAISTPGAPNGRFYDIHAQGGGYEDWWVRHVTMKEVLAAGQMSKAWQEARLKQWGEESSVYQNRVMGEFASKDASNVIPLAWVEAAQRRWRKIYNERRMDDVVVEAVGVDVADQGADKTVFARQGRLDTGEIVSLKLERHSKDSTMVTSGKVTGMYHRYRGSNPSFIIDAIGLGAGVVARTREVLGDDAVVGFNSSRGTKRRDISGELGFINWRAAAWWNMREMLDPMNKFDLALPPDDQLRSELVAPEWTLTSGGRIKIEAKDAVKERLGRSPDAADAVVMSFWQTNVRQDGPEAKPGFDERYRGSVLRRRDRPSPTRLETARKKTATEQGFQKKVRVKL